MLATLMTSSENSHSQTFIIKKKENTEAVTWALPTPKCNPQKIRAVVKKAKWNPLSVAHSCVKTVELWLHINSLVHACNKTRRVRLKVTLYYGLWIYEIALWLHVFIICREVINFYISHFLKTLLRRMTNEELLFQLHTYCALTNIIHTSLFLDRLIIFKDVPWGQVTITYRLQKCFSNCFAILMKESMYRDRDVV